MNKTIKIKPLFWEEFIGHFGNNYIARIDGFDTNYCYWFDRHSNKFKCSGVDRKHHYFETEQATREWCQGDFEEKVNKLLQK